MLLAEARDLADSTHSIALLNQSWLCFAFGSLMAAVALLFVLLDRLLVLHANTRYILTWQARFFLLSLGCTLMYPLAVLLYTNVLIASYDGETGKQRMRRQDQEHATRTLSAVNVYSSFRAPRISRKHPFGTEDCTNETCIKRDVSVFLVQSRLYVTSCNAVCAFAFFALFYVHSRRQRTTQHPLRVRRVSAQAGLFVFTPRGRLQTHAVALSTALTEFTLAFLPQATQTFCVGVFSVDLM